MSEAVSQLQSQVTELQKENDKLQKRIRNQDEQLQKADELNQEMLELRPKHWLTTEELRIKNEQLQQASTEIQQLKQENLELQKQVGNSLAPDYEATRDSEALRRTAERTLSKLKMGRQSAAGKAIDAFIKELAKLPMPNTQSLDLGNLGVGFLVDLAIAELRQHQTETRYFEDLRRIAKLCGYQLFRTTKGYEAKDITSNEFVFTTGEIGAIVEWLRPMSPQISR